MNTVNENVIPMRKKQGSDQKWMRAKAAMEYFQVGRTVLDKIARECDAISRFGDKIVLYDVQKIEKYIKVAW